MKVFIKGKGHHVELGSNEYISQGGQGKVYAKGNLVYKIYHDASNVIPEAKMQELSVLSDPSVIKPEDILCNSKNKVVGYTMRFVADTHPLCKLFTKSFKQRENISSDQILKLVQRMQDTVQHIHSNDILVVDLNEMNFLVSSKFDEAYFIDVDSYQTKSFPATVLMESVRDRHAKGFTELTDWFSFAIVSFQMFIGIHPYKGKHPKYNNLDERMINNVSVLNKTVTIPAICSPFSDIPKEYLEWYINLFEKGERQLPPFKVNKVVVSVVKVQQIKDNSVFDIVEMLMTDKEIINYLYHNGAEVIVTEDSVYYNGKKEQTTSKESVFGFTPKMNSPIGACSINGHTVIYSLEDGTELHRCLGKSAMAYEGRIYIQNNTNILEVEFIEGKKVLVGCRPVANCLENATQMFDGAVIQNLLGSYFASFFPSPGQHIQVPIKELEGYKVLDAKYDHGIFMVVASKSGKYDRLVLKFGDDWSYNITVVKDVVYSGINFTGLDNNICVCINEEEKVELFSTRKDKPDIKEISSDTIDSSMKLFHKGTKVLFSKGNKLYSMSMRK